METLSFGGRTGDVFLRFLRNVSSRFSLILMKIGSFVSRHLGPRLEDQNAMLRTLGAPSLDSSRRSTTPGTIRKKGEEDAAVLLRRGPPSGAEKGGPPASGWATTTTNAARAGPNGPFQ